MVTGWIVNWKECGGDMYTQAFSTNFKTKGEVTCQWYKTWEIFEFEDLEYYTIEKVK